MSVFSEQVFEKKLLALKDSQESISTLSDWCLQNKQHHKKIVGTWLNVLKKVRVENRLTLFYLANDVVQYSKRKNYDFVESWGTALQKATTMVRHDKVMNRIMRIFKIWGDRNVYNEEFLTDLRGLLTAKKATPATPKQSEQQAASTTSTSTPGEFVPSNLYTRMSKCKELEDDTDLKLKVVNDCKLINLNDLDAFRTMLKDRKHADGAAGELDEAICHVEKYKKALEVEILERKTVIDLLQQATKFYETEKSDAKVVFNAYRNFGSRVKSLKRKLDELVPSLASPVPSPDVNAPSPSPDSDIDLPNDDDLSGIVECLEGTAESDSEDDLMSIISYHSSDEENPKYSYYELLRMPDRLRRRSLPLPDPSYSDSDLTELDDSFEDSEEFHDQYFQNIRRKCPPTFGSQIPGRCSSEGQPGVAGYACPSVVSHSSNAESQSSVCTSGASFKPCSTDSNIHAVIFKEPSPRKSSHSLLSDNVSPTSRLNCSMGDVNSPTAQCVSSVPSVRADVNSEENPLKTESDFNTSTNGLLDLSGDFLPSDEDLSGLLECLGDDLLDIPTE